MRSGGDEPMDVRMARSKAGRDKDQIFVIVKEDRENVYLADGKYRSVENPKRKNKKHIQVIYHIPEEAREVLEGKAVPGDVEIKRALKLYQMREHSRQED
ncbi:MAG: KOW domain-containing RNA-binding protein [Clostridiales bacterium]|nr:KOW domain-containing RNA-binding protein [Clostridiales bacterium]